MNGAAVFNYQLHMRWRVKNVSVHGQPRKFIHVAVQLDVLDGTRGEDAPPHRIKIIDKFMEPAVAQHLLMVLAAGTQTLETSGDFFTDPQPSRYDHIVPLDAP